ncbi:MAG: ATP-dependent ligase [Myxococcaceae bacterium]|nr:ATP-dependent ligase [Myxococcaceae bacterium]
MRSVAEALFTSEGTGARTAKVEALASALADVYAREPARLPFAARFLTGTMLPTEDDRTLGAGGALVFEAAASVSGMAPEELGARARKAGDLGTAVGEAMEARAAVDGRGAPPGLTLEAAESVALALAETGTRREKLRALCTVLEACTPLEARYLARAILGEMRVGAKEGIVLDAIAKAFGRTLADVRRAAGLVTDVGHLALLAAQDRLADARVVVGRPLGFMLATPIETARGADLEVPHAVEDKIDGIRAQAHVAAAGVHLFARGQGPVTKAFPDVAGPLAEAARNGLRPAILDGEIVVMTAEGRPRPFSAIQPRLKKTEPDEDLVRAHPVRYVVYDILFEGDEVLLGLPFLERRARLVKWLAAAPAPLVLHDSRPLVSKDALDAEFDAARARGFEGLVLKRLDAVYAAGVRGFAWLKVKKALATLDVVVVAAERGHGKRAGVLSDYTFAVRSDGELLTVGKAYSGLTDVEIQSMTARLEAIAIGEEQHGYLRVRPEIVLEVAFDGLQKSDRHSSGFALRFPRIAHIRDDKKPDEADTLDSVRALWESQLASGHREDLTAKDRKSPKPAPPKKGRKSGRRPDIRAKSKQLKLFDDD